MRCLTACSRKQGNWQMRFANIQIETCYISVSSPQEREIVGVSVVQFIEEIKKLVEDTIFIPLQSNSTTQQPNGEVYLQAFFDAGFDIQPIVSFDINANTINLPVNLYNTQNTPSNQTASEVRKLWGLI
jgi:hypothetical protein